MQNVDKKLEDLSPEQLKLFLLKLQRLQQKKEQSATIQARSHIVEELPLSFTQERLWFLDQLETGHAFYNIALAVRLLGPLNVGLLEQSLNTVVARHESLRTIFVSKDRRSQQIVLPELRITLPIQDLRQQPEREREESARRQALELVRQPFNLAQAPLLRGHLYRLQDQEYVLVFSIHHIISDGWSMGILVQELATLYTAYVDGYSSPLSPLPVQYADYALWQRERLQGEVLEGHLAYWRQQLEHAPVLLPLPTDRPRPPVQSHRGAKAFIHLSQHASDMVRRVCQRESVTPYMFLLASWAVLLGRLSGQEDIVVGSPIAGRQHKELEGLIGFFVNTLALRIDLSGQPTFKQLLEKVREVTLKAYEHQELPFEKLVEELAPQRDLSYQSLFQTMFILQNTPKAKLSSDALTLESINIDNQTAKYDIELSLSEIGGCFDGYLEYSTDLFNAESIQRFLSYWQHILEEVLHDINRPVATLKLMDDSDVYKLYDVCNSVIEALPIEIQRACMKFLPDAQTRTVVSRVLDRYGNLAPVGITGQLMIADVSTCVQSLDTHFIPTGLLALWRADGTLEYKGQSDELITMNGFRINLHEIASIITNLSAIKACVVTYSPIAADSTLLAYLVPQEPDQFQLEHLRTTLKEYLPSYQLPRHFIVLEDLPYRQDGSVDRMALPEPESMLQQDNLIVDNEPCTPLEETLVRIWQEVLQVEQVGIHDNFFELGGHSLLATQVVARLGEALGEQGGSISAELEGVLISALFEEPTIAALAASIEQNGQQDVGEQVPELQVVDHQGDLPLSFTQERMWFLDQLEPNSAFYNISAGVRLLGPLQVPALQQSLNALVARHESLRTIFVQREGQPWQQIMEPLPLTLSMLDVSQEEEGQREERARQRVLAEAMQPFDLARGPLMRAYLIRMKPQEHVLVLTMHHIVSDGWSMGVLVRELSTFYAGYAQGKPVELPALPIQYADYAVWQRAWLQGMVLEQQIEYWRERLRGAPALLELPTDRPRPPVQSHRGAKAPVRLSPQLSQAIKRVSQQQGVTPYMVLLASWSILLGRLSGQQDLVIGSPIAGRKRVELEGLIGFFVNTLALRINCTGLQTFREVLKMVSDVTLGAYTHQELPFEKVVEELAPQRDLSHHQIFQVMFILQNTPSSGTLPFSDLTMQPLDIDNQTAKYDLELALAEVNERFEGYLEYSSDLFEEATIQRWLVLWEWLIENLVHDIDQPLSLLKLLDEFHENELLQTSYVNRSTWPIDLRYLLNDWDQGADDVIDILPYRVVDGYGHTCPPGVVGALHLTEQPTREYVRYHQDGSFEYVGHQDDLVTVSGFLINLHEIEAILKQQVAIASCAVCACREPESEKICLVAYIERREYTVFTQEQLRATLKKCLPGYKIPTYFVWIEALPLNERGKIDRALLPDFTMLEQISIITTSEPRTPLEETLVRIWQEVLQVEQVGIHDNFFELGGHSLLATQVVARLGEALGEQGGSISAELEGVLISALFEEPTIAALAASIEQNGQQDAEDQGPELQVVDHQGDLPLSFTQERMWFLDQLEPNSAFYNISAGVRLLGPLQVPALQQSLNALVARHESLRTIFVQREGQPWQQIMEHLPLTLSMLDVSQEEEGQREERARQRVLAEAMQPFDLARGPLMRAYLIRMKPQEHVLVLTMHHIVSDGWSMGVLVRELSTFYAGYAQGSRWSCRRCDPYADYAVCSRGAPALRCMPRLAARGGWCLSSRLSTGESGCAVLQHCWNCPRIGHDRRCKAIVGPKRQYDSPRSSARRSSG
ncbi:condensation domain-containing protein [Dictyobacter kobayashii]|uniref:Carrier domain-containing protein n=1 Tax=Dictyobacter kobayashii TaxID=2014872 RepID=A0A402ASL6_9CHLR|nr:condensation domain-containing protein [Dictyobacter kobayashii]GCE22081.1 hypothetical protein KDK_58810 [Dictyobacter kobayashii]